MRGMPPKAFRKRRFGVCSVPPARLPSFSNAVSPPGIVQRTRAENSIFFWADRNKFIAIYAGDELIKRAKHVKLNPAEMIRIKLDAKSIEKAKETGLEVRIIG